MDVSKAISVMFHPGDECNVLQTVSSKEAVIGGYIWNLTVKFNSAQKTAFASLRCLTTENVKATIKAYRSYFSKNHDLLSEPGEHTFSADSSYEISVQVPVVDSVILTMLVAVEVVRDSAVVVDQPFADVVLKVEGERFRCNRGFLSAVSPVFGAMFNTDFKEKNQLEVTVGDVDAASFGTFLMAIHPEKPIGVTSANVATIAGLADRFQVGSLLVRCVVIVQNDDAISNLDKLFLLEELTQHDALNKCIKRLSPSEMKEVANDERFLALSKECMQTLLQHNTRDA